MSYPAIKYNLRRMDKVIANNKAYSVNKSYLVTVIDLRPDSPITDKLTHLDMCTHEQHYVTDGLHHDTFVIHY